MAGSGLQVFDGVLVLVVDGGVWWCEVRVKASKQSREDNCYLKSPWEPSRQLLLVERIDRKERESRVRHHCRWKEHDILLVAMRYNDLRNGTNQVDEVLEKYKNAWAKKGMASDNGLFREWYRPKQDDMVDGHDVSFTAW